jgi:3-oxoacyl-[acyl-carrier protein] reductase
MSEPLIAAKPQFLTEQALGRLGEPEDIADTLVFLASDSAAYITGTSVEISGGKFCVQNPQYAW